MSTQMHIAKQKLLNLIRQIDRHKEDSLSEKEQLTLLTSRMSYSRILSTAFEDQSELPLSHCLLSEAYYNVGCLARALTHSMIAVRSQNLSHLQIQSARIILSKCCLQLGNLDEAIDRLEELQTEFRRQYQNQQNQSITTTRLLEVQSLLVTCLCKKQMFSHALSKQDEYLNVCNKKYGNSSVQFALGLVQKGRVLASSDIFYEAENHQQKAIDILITLSFNKADIVPDLYVTLASYQRHNGNLENEYSSLVKARNIYNELCTQNSMKLIEVRRHIAINLEGRGKLFECLKEWTEIREMEKTAYGEITNQVGRSERKIGDIYVLLEKGIQAIKHYLKAISIFEENGQRKNVAELEQSIKELRERKSSYRRNLKSAQNTRC